LCVPCCACVDQPLLFPQLNVLPLQENNMCGSIIRHKPLTMAQLQHNVEAYHIFQNVDIALEFAQNLQMTTPKVCGICFRVT
jgi:hypothetical protein